MVVAAKEDSLLGLIPSRGEWHDMKHLLAGHGQNGRRCAVGCGTRRLLDVAAVVKAGRVV